MVKNGGGEGQSLRGRENENGQLWKFYKNSNSKKYF